MFVDMKCPNLFAVMENVKLGIIQRTISKGTLFHTTRSRRGRFILKTGRKLRLERLCVKLQRKVRPLLDASNTLKCAKMRFQVFFFKNPFLHLPHQKSVFLTLQLPGSRPDRLQRWTR
eukprot:UN13341